VYIGYFLVEDPRSDQPEAGPPRIRECTALKGQVRSGGRPIDELWTAASSLGAIRRLDVLDGDCLARSRGAEIAHRRAWASNLPTTTKSQAPRLLARSMTSGLEG
jgi:hypothetical protein